MAIDWQYYHWHLEPSAVCTLRCPRCPRTEHPDTPWMNKTMSFDFFKSFMTPEMLTNKVRRITMCGDVGDPIYCKDYIEIYQYIKTINPKIHVYTITNGSNRSTAWWQQLAQVANAYDTINFGIDGYDDASNNLYRIGSNWDSIMDGIRTVRKHNQDIFLNWAVIMFKFNEDHLDNIVAQATALGMDAVQITKSTKFGSKYGTAYQGIDDPLEPSSKWVSSTHRYERSMIHLNTRRIDNQLYLDHNYDKYVKIKQKYATAPIVPLCEIGNRGLYVNAEGVVFPCSWTSFPYTSLSHNNKTIQWQDSFFAQHRDRMNLHNRSLDEILTDPLWNKCSQGWSDPDKTWVECSQKCSNQLVTQEYAVGWETN